MSYLHSYKVHFSFTGLRSVCGMVSSPTIVLVNNTEWESYQEKDQAQCGSCMAWLTREANILMEQTQAARRERDSLPSGNGG